MSILFDMMKAFGFGVILFFIAPLFAGLLPWEPRDRLPGAKSIIIPYQKIAMALIDRGVLLQQSHGGLKLKKSEYYPKIPTERVTIGRQTKDYKDPANLMGTFHGKPFGLVHEEWAAIVDARTLYFIRKFRELHDQNEWERKSMKKAYFSIDRDGDEELVSITDLMDGGRPQSASPNLVERLTEFAKKSQAGYNSTQLFQQTKFFIALGVGVGLMWLLKEAGGAAGDVGRVLPAMVGVGG